MRELLNSNGENQAVRCFLMLHGEKGVTVAKMKMHLSLCGYPRWPAWVETPDAQGHLTKAGAQDWLRHLFGLESTHNAEVTGSPASSASPCGLPGSAAADNEVP